MAAFWPGLPSWRRRSFGPAGRELKRRRPNLAVLLTSGYAEAARQGIEANGFRVLAKPYRFEDLKAALAQVFQPHDTELAPGGR